MPVIIGIDPGSQKTGFGIIRADGARCTYLASGVIRVAELEFPQRLKCIFESIRTIIDEHHPEMMVVEQVFMAKNAGSALKLGQARGAAITAGVTAGLEVAEYSARQIKLAVAGTGAAEKCQVQHMVKTLLLLDKNPQEDAADALAAAICHAHSYRSQALMNQTAAFQRSGRRS